MDKKIILDLCGGTGAWSKPYKDNGYDVRLITLPDYDVRTYQPPENVYGILAAPPCTHFSGSGARWWKAKGKEKLLEGLAIVDACMRIILISKSVFWALENPVGRLSKFLGKPKMYFNPCDYGDPYTKKTCLWGNFNELKKDYIKPTKSWHNKIHYPKLNGKALSWNGEEIKRIRSITPAGFAKAFFDSNR